MPSPRDRKAAGELAQQILNRATDPLTYAQATMDIICDRLARGESLRTICKTQGLPDVSTIRRWMEGNEIFRAQYARAREAQAEHYAAEIIEIADSCEDWGKARLQIDARKWYASKLKPKVYGDKTAVDVTGQLTLEQLVLASMSKPESDS